VVVVDGSDCEFYMNLIFVKGFVGLVKTDRIGINFDPDSKIMQLSGLGEQTHGYICGMTSPATVEELTKELENEESDFRPAAL